MRSGLLLATAGVAVSLGGVEANVSLQDRINEVRSLLESQNDVIKKHHKEIDQLEAKAEEKRRLQAAAPTTTTTTLFQVQTDYSGALNHIWLILCGSLVMFMQAGFAMVEAGCCRAKNVQNILLKNLTDVAVGTMGWWTFGWSFAYSGPMDGKYKANKFMGYEEFFGHHFLISDDDGNQQPTDKMMNWFFQWAFCSASATIVSGGVAERVNFPGYCIFSFAMTVFIYPIVVSWTWGYGWLSDYRDVGYIDFAGSGIVHMAGGVGALVGAAIAGPRTGRWEDPDRFQPHSLPLVVLGTFILFFGWYGFNCGSTLALSDAATGQLAAQVAMNTTIAGSTAGLVVFGIRLVMNKGLYDIGGFCNGMLAGLVSITAGCANVEVGWAFGIAVFGACLYQAASILMIRLKVDDPIDAFAVHGTCGAWGVLAAAIFDWGGGDGFFHGWSGFDCMRNAEGQCRSGIHNKGIESNLAEIFFISLWVGSFSALIFAPLRFSGFLRASDTVQDSGFDQAKHSPSKAYAFGS